MGHILDESQERNIFSINKAEFKKKHKFHEAPTNDAWKVNLIKEITDINHSVLVLSGDKPEEVENFTEDELTEILDYIATFWFVMTFNTVCELSDVRTAINNNN